MLASAIFLRSFSFPELLILIFLEESHITFETSYSISQKKKNNYGFKGCLLQLCRCRTSGTAARLQDDSTWKDWLTMSHLRDDCPNSDSGLRCFTLAKRSRKVSVLLFELAKPAITRTEYLQHLLDGVADLVITYTYCDYSVRLGQSAIPGADAAFYLRGSCRATSCNSTKLLLYKSYCEEINSVSPSDLK